MRILVTGATGFLGGAASRQLRQRGHVVLGSGRNRARGAALERDGIAFLPGDLTDRSGANALCQGVDAVVHCAALSSPWGPRSAFVSANVEATELLIAACQEAGVGRLVYISSPSIYMGAGDREGVREDDPLSTPINDYAATKLEAEHRVRSAHEAGLKSIILRPRAIFGPGDTTLFPRLIRTLESGPLPVFGDGHNRVDLTYIDNAVSAIECALGAPPSATGLAYNITNGEPVRLWDIIARLCDALALSPPRGRVPRPLGTLLAGGLERLHRWLRPQVEPRLTRYTVEVLARTMTLDIGRARRLLGYVPEVSMDEGLSRFVRWSQEQRCRA
jgi:nucleoside-diphosphate-sugar epimerase